MSSTSRPRWGALLRPLALAVVALALFAIPSPKHGSAGPAQPNFVRSTLNLTLDSPTSLAFGPDGRLYAAHVPGGSSQSSEIIAYTLNPATKSVTGTQVIGSSLDDVMGIAFDPTAPASPVKVYASRRDRSATDGFESKVSVFTGPAWTRTDIITGLPTGRPSLNHLTNGLAFASDGKLYIAQGSQTDSGIVEGQNWPETPLSAAILVANVNVPGFNGAITYSPAGAPMSDTVDKTGGDVSVFAAGTRNSFDLLVHSNGKIYATDNGPSGPNPSATCMTSAGGVSTSDELNLIEAGNYYGHPNRNRGRTDARQCTYRAPEEGNGVDFTGPIDLLPAHCSCDGITEYIGTAFGGSMQGDLLIAGLQTSQVYRVELSGDGSSVVSDTSLAGAFNAPLDVAAGSDGTIYVAEFGGDKITYLAPDSDRDGCADSRELGTQGALGGARDPDVFWDFFDTPDVNNVRDRIISAGDILRLVFRFGSTGSPSIDPLSMPGASGYHTAFDRSAPATGADPWDLGPPDGSISAGDILFVVRQFGHTCA